MENMDKTDEFDFGVAQSLLKSNSKKKSGKISVEDEIATSFKLDTGHPTRDTKIRNGPGRDRTGNLYCSHRAQR